MEIEKPVEIEPLPTQPLNTAPSKVFDLKINSIIKKLNTVNLTAYEPAPSLKITKTSNFESNGKYILNSALILFFLTITRIGPTLCQANFFTEAFRFKKLMVCLNLHSHLFRIMIGMIWIQF